MFGGSCALARPHEYCPKEKDMSVESIITIVFAAVAALCSAAALVVSLRRRGGGGADDRVLRGESDRLQRELTKEIDFARQYIANSNTDTSNVVNNMLMKYLESTAGSLNAVRDEMSKSLALLAEQEKASAAMTDDKLGKNLDAVKNDFKTGVAEMRSDLFKQFTEIRKELSENVEKMRAEVQSRLNDVRNDNEKQLEKMRATVDEKLSETLDKRVQAAFQQVSDRLDSVQKGFGEMQQLTAKVGDLNRIFADVKKRGNWGEVALQSLFEQILSPEQYEVQFRVSPHSQEAVDFAIVLPGQLDEKVYLPVDAKFPLEDYGHLVDASETGDKVAVELARKKLLDRVKSEAKSIAAKYIKPPRTTNFAVMYVPNEGLYAEIMRDGAFVSDLQTQCGVTVCGPTTVAALLNSLQVGFTTLKIQKQSGEMLKLMVKVKKDFGKFTELIRTVKTRAESVVKAVNDIDFRNQQIVRKLDKFEDIEPQLPEAAASTDVPAEEE